MQIAKSDETLVFDITNDPKHTMILKDARGNMRACGTTIPELFASFVEKRLPCAKLPPMFASAMLSYVRRIPVTIGSSEMQYLSTLYSDLKAAEHERPLLAEEPIMDGPDNA